jgi:SAM-dependent methyltransferase
MKKNIMVKNTEFDRHDFWKNPDKSNQSEAVKKICKPDYYLDLDGITNLIVNTLKKYLEFEDTIYELGCGTGRNLAGLKEAGFKNLSGVEINKDAVELGRKTFSYLKGIPVTVGTVEDTIKSIPQQDCIFTQGILQHLPYDTDWIHQEMINKSKKIIMVIENEKPQGVRSWARNYNDVFTKLGLKEIESHSKTGLKGHSNDTFIRIFRI